MNGHLATLFPTLFGGGDAKLVMTGEEILDAGVQVMAHPPGKRNTSIHLLSGGEKALTAIALVFSLFQLNPAPFCLLDEVDAPLDDSNTLRFCDLVQRMSAQTQFLFISHNKITMEMAYQLVGVTMPESGVSRVVAVDIEEALRIRGGARGLGCHERPRPRSARARRGAVCRECWSTTACRNALGAPRFAVPSPLRRTRWRARRSARADPAKRLPRPPDRRVDYVIELESASAVARPGARRLAAARAALRPPRVA